MLTSRVSSSSGGGGSSTTTVLTQLYEARAALAPQVGTQLRALCAALYTEQPLVTLFTWVHCVHDTGDADNAARTTAGTAGSGGNQLESSMRVLLDVVLCAPLDFRLETRGVTLFGEAFERRGASGAQPTTMIDSALVPRGGAGHTALHFFMQHAPVLFDRVETPAVGATDTHRWSHFCFPHLLTAAVQRHAVAAALAGVYMHHAAGAERTVVVRALIIAAVRSMIGRHAERVGFRALCDAAPVCDQHHAALVRDGNDESNAAFARLLAQLLATVSRQNTR